MSTQPTRRLAAGAAIAVMAFAGAAAPTAFARHGADDPVTHDHGGARSARHGGDDRRFDDRGRHHGRRHHRAHDARHGADDAPGHVRHGGDDGPNHR